MAVTPSSRPVNLPAAVRARLAARISPGSRVCIGLSGGLDSVMLLHVVAHLDLVAHLSAVHVHHGLSPRAEQWVQFCRDYCARLGIPLSVERVQVTGRGEGLEAAARRARYEVFAKLPADLLLLAQHGDDQAETVLFNLLRGCGLTGAAGMPACRSLGALTLLRPLFDCRRADILAYAREHGLAWVDDESNEDRRFSRNFLRHEILPRLTERFPVVRSLASAAEHFAEADGLLRELAEEDWRICGDGDSLVMGRVRALSAPRLKNLVRYRLYVLGWRSPVASRLEEFVRQLRQAAPDAHPALTLPDGEMRVRGGRLHWRSVDGQSG